MTQKRPLESFLAVFEESQWLEFVDALMPKIHEVDRNATAIWFRFYPISLKRFIDSAENRDETLAKMQMQGTHELRDQIDTSHRFLFGHRYWGTVKKAIDGKLDSTPTDLGSLVEDLSKVASESEQVSRELVRGIIMVGLMTLVQAGSEAFSAAEGKSLPTFDALKGSPDSIVAQRAKDEPRGIFSFLKSVDKRFTVSWMDAEADGKFGITNDADIASASALDQSSDWKGRDERCWEGVVPVECRSAACGACWVGVLGGEEKLSEVQRLERKQTKIFGYNMPESGKPFLRLACQAKTYGNVTIVIPPWNAVFGRKVYGVENSKLEPATTSAKKLREILAESEGPGE
jgi:ferredoxin